jgi:hypothetical protein
MDILKVHQKKGREGQLVQERSMMGNIDEALKQGKVDDEARRDKHRNKKRERADKKFGHGGKNKRMKRNDEASSADTSGFNHKKNSAHGVTGKKGTGKGAGSNKKSAAAARPGKARRASTK